MCSTPKSSKIILLGFLPTHKITSAFASSRTNREFSICCISFRVAEDEVCRCLCEGKIQCSPKKKVKEIEAVTVFWSIGNNCFVQSSKKHCLSAQLHNTSKANFFIIKQCHFFSSYFPGSFSVIPLDFFLDSRLLIFRKMAQSMLTMLIFQRNYGHWCSEIFQSTCGKKTLKLVSQKKEKHATKPFLWRGKGVRRL